MNTFIEVCELVCFPVAKEKTEWATQVIVFLGLLIDCLNRVICIPKEKIERALMLINSVLQGKHRKATMIQIQRLSGYLNFLCKCVVPGRAFTTRLYSLISSKLLPHHHVKIPVDVVQDLIMWKDFLERPQAYCRPS